MLSKLFKLFGRDRAAQQPEPPAVEPMTPPAVEPTEPPAPSPAAPLGPEDDDLPKEDDDLQKTVRRAAVETAVRVLLEEVIGRLF
ncbi:hypothetical protein ACFT0G_31055 [Streptomyces sp. NPDC057020]|uniref:hypothetical protein n=1 Tax=unclassified Streptomyces TaxID=2593676 RepID=UPI00363717A7